MSKPVYRHPVFVTNASAKQIESENKRLWLSLTIDENLKDSIIVILKNPSRATKFVSDKTIYNVTSWIYKNRMRFRQLENVGTIIVLNLIPFYETYSEKLVKSDVKIIDKENLRSIKTLTGKHKNVIIAWGDHPKGLLKEFEELKKAVFSLFEINKNSVFYIDKLSVKGNPKHGMVWGYDNELLEYK